MKKILIIFCIFVFASLIFAKDLAKFWFDAANNTDDPILKELYLLRAIKENNNFTEAYKALGIFYYTHGKMEKAKQYLEYLPKQSITLPEDRVINIVKPEEVKAKPEEEINKKLDDLNKKIDTLSSKIAEKQTAEQSKPETELSSKLDKLANNIDQLIKSQKQEPPKQEEKPAPAQTVDNKELYSKFDSFAEKIEQLLNNQNSKIDTINNNYTDIVANINNQSTLINQLSDKTIKNTKNIEELNKKFETLLNEINSIKTTQKTIPAPTVVPLPIPAPVTAQEPTPAPAPAPVVQQPAPPAPVPAPAPVVQQPAPQAPAPVSIPTPTPVPAPVVQQPAPVVQQAAPPTPLPVKKLVNINTGTEEELSTLPTLNNIEAILIVKYRERYGSFKTKEDIKRVPGLAKKYDDIKDYISVEDAGQESAVAAPVPVPAPGVPPIPASAPQQPVQQAAPAPIAQTQPIAPSGKIDINTATTDDLLKTGKITKLDAMLIVRYRERYGKFKTIENIKEVPGINEVKFADIKDLIEIK